MAEAVGGDDGLLEYLPAFRQIIGPGIRQRLKEGERHDQFSDTADVLPMLAAILGIARVRRIGEIEDRHAVTVGILAQEIDYLPGEYGIRSRQFQVLVIEQAQVHLCRREQGAGSSRGDNTCNRGPG